MSPRRKIEMHIALPPRALALSHAPSSPCTPLPHTPMPYDLPAGLSVRIDSGGSKPADEEVAEIGQKRFREDEVVEPEWTEEELEQLQSSLIHPFQPLSVQYPPGQLPPKEALDELTHQVILYASRPSPVKHSPRHATSFPSTAQTAARDASPGRTASTPEEVQDQKGQAPSEGWLHGWDATRRKLFEIALADSKFGQDEKERKMSRADRQARPGLRRVDSMDFLDQAEEKGAEHPGRAMRLSTSLQNSARQEPLFVSMSRSPSAGSTIAPTLTRSSSACSTMSTPDLASITLTPPSPQSAIMCAASAPVAPSSRRRSSARSSSGQTRAGRPSLLQRGRSFTASDLQEEADAQALAQAGIPQGSPIREENNPARTASPPSPLPRSSTPPTRPATRPARITRSQSTTFITQHPAHAARDAFLAHPPLSALENSSLAVPLKLGVTPNSSSGWSDSEDEGVKAPRVIKKVKGGAGRKAMSLKLGNVLDGMAIGDGLSSPFEEKTEIRF